MPVAPPRRLVGGYVHTSIEAGPDDFASCTNLYDEHGSLRKRDGQTPIRQVGTYTVSGFNCGWANGTAVPATVSTTSINASTGSGIIGAASLYFGGSSTFRQFSIKGDVESSATWVDFVSAYLQQRSLTWEYWNGSAWTTFFVADCFKPQGDGTSLLLHPFAPWFVDGSGNPVYNNANQLTGVIEPPSDWATLAIGGQTKYWARARNIPAKYLAQLTSSVNAAASQFTTSEQPIIWLMYFRDRRGTPHEFVIQVQANNVLAFILDGTTLTGSDSLVPDTSPHYTAATRAWAYYDSSTDRVIGFNGDVWFYAIMPGNGEIYHLRADQAGTSTPYQSVVGGLRSDIPPGTVAATYDDRIFAAEGQALRYSSPGTYKDIWPNDNELFIADDVGNITALASVGGVLAVFKRDSIWVAQSDGSADGYKAWRVPGNVGCVAPRSIAVAGNVAFFLAEDGVFTFDGQSTSKVSRKIDGWFTPGWSSAPENAWGVWYSRLNQYRLYYPGPGSTPHVMDSALYMTTNEGDKPPSFWPQGKNVNTDWSFNATCVTADASREVTRVCTGDKFGCVWELDRGLYDGGTAVTFEGVTHRINLGQGIKYLMRWIVPSQPAATNAAWSMAVWADGNTAAEQTLTLNAGVNMDAGAFHVASTNHASGTTYAVNNEHQTLPPQSVEVQGRFVQLELSDAVAAPWALHAIELEVARMGRAG